MNFMLGPFFYPLKKTLNLCLLQSFLFITLIGQKVPEPIWNPKVTYDTIITQAQAGSPYYQGLLGIYLRSGEAGCAVNLKLASDWSQVSWSKGHPLGAYNLANLAILRGDFEGATQLYQDAALLLQRKASDGDAVAMYCMGEIDFQVIPTNVRRALEFFKKSAELGYPPAQATIGTLYLKGLPNLLEQDYRKGIALISRAVSKKSLTARFNLAMAYYNGDGVPKDSAKASQWLEVAVRQNFSEAQYTLGLMLFEGDGIPKNTNRGVSLLKDAASQGHQLANNYLIKRNGSPPDFRSVKTKNTRQEPDENISDESILDQARKSYTGVGHTKNYEKAYGLFFPLAKSGNPQACRFIGLMKLTGKGTDKSVSSAKQWLSLAAQKGDQTAIRMLNDYAALFKGH